MHIRIVLFLIVFQSVHLFADGGERIPIISGERVNIHSKILNEERTIWVSQPAGYENSTAAYPVLYLLDGPGHFSHTAGIIDFLSGQGMAPQVLIVGIANTDRTRDLTPTVKIDTSGQWAAGGGADPFLGFINSELKPFVKKNYRTHDYEILVGHSFGGLFAIHTFLEEPASFDAYVSISPSLWWDEMRLVTDAAAGFRNIGSENKFLYISVGGEGDRMIIPARKFAAQLEISAPQQLTWDFRYMPVESHGSIPHRTTYDALEMLYSGWRLPTEIAQQGTLEAVDQHFADLSKKFGYEIVTPENVVNLLGYRHIGAAEYAEAIRVLKRNVEMYPKSANVYDSLGDAYAANGDDALALKYYEKAYKLAKAGNHPNTAIYEQNYQRQKEKPGTD